MLRLLFIAMIFPSVNALATGTRVDGRVYYEKLDPKMPSFLFHGDVTEENGKTIAVSTYLDPAGKVLITETCEIVNNRLVKYDYKQDQVGESGETYTKDGKIFMTFHQESGTETDSETDDPTLVVSPMIGPLLARNWDELMNGESIKVRYMAIERVETIGFKFFKEKEFDYHGVPAVDVIMKPSSFIIAAIVDPIHITLEKAPPHRIMETNGRLPVRVSLKPPPRVRKDWKAIDARVEYDLPQPFPPPAPPAPPPPPTPTPKPKAAGQPKAKPAKK